MRLTKKIVAAALCLMMLLGLQACSQTAQAPAEDTAAPVSSIDRDAVAMKVGDVTITAGEVEDSYNEYIEMMTYYGYQAPTSDEDIETIQDTVLKTLAETAVVKYMVKEKGADQLTDEQKAIVEKAVQEEVNNLHSYYLEDGEDISDEAVLQKVKDAIAADLEAYEMNMDYDGYIETIREYQMEAMEEENLKAAVQADVVVTEEDARAYYDELLADQKATTEEPGAYLGSEMDYEMYGGDPVLVVPENYARIKVLTINPEGTIDEAYQGLKDQMKELEAEYGNLVLSGSDNKERVAEIEKAYAELKTSTETMREEFFGTVKETAEVAYGELQSGKSFDEVFAEYNTDSSYKDYPTIMEKGRLILLSEDDGTWDEATRETVNNLKNGEYSEIIEGDNGFSIIYRVSDEPAGEKSFDDVKDVIVKLTTDDEKEKAWETQKTAWLEDTSLVTYYPETYQSIGKQ